MELGCGFTIHTCVEPHHLNTCEPKRSGLYANICTILWISNCPDLRTSQRSFLDMIMIKLLAISLLVSWGTTTSLHQPCRQTWVLTDGETGNILNYTTHTGPLGTWWPDLYFYLRDLYEKTHTKKPSYHVLMKRTLMTGDQIKGFWACPSNQRANYHTCWGAESFCCKAWSCVTSNDGDHR